jgi:hypothetical protein
MEAVSSFDLQQIWNVFSNLLYYLVVFGISLYYVIHKQSTDSYLLLGGSVIHLFTGIFFTVILPIVVRNSGGSIYQSGIIMIMSVVAFVGSIIFITGLIILIINHLQLCKKVQE